MAGLIGGIIQAGATKSAAKDAANAQLQAAQINSAATNRAVDLAQQQYQTTRSDLMPFTQAGETALPYLQMAATGGQVGSQPNYLAMAGANLPGTMTQAQLEATPGYQFTLGQGLKAVQNSAAARGLGVSGAAMKGAAQYATGLADSTYKDQFAIQQQRYADMFGMGQQQYSNLSNLASLGSGAAAQTGNIGANLINQAGTNLVTGAGRQGQNVATAGADIGAGTVGSANAIAGGINNFFNQANQNLLAAGYGGQTGGFG